MHPRLSKLLQGVALSAALADAARSTITFRNNGNPLIADGSLYSADPAPLVVNDTFYIISGQDSAPPSVEGFVMNDWVLFSTEDPNPAGSNWTLHRNFLEPNKLFAWADEGDAYASQIVVGKDGRYYIYSPVMQRNYTTPDGFGVGVGVADLPTGPYTDHHPSGPIVSQSYPSPGNNIENIDPTVFIDDDGKVYMYWGTFGALMGVELADDMATFVGDPVQVTTLDGFFEASWLTKRNGTYYLIYADNQLGTNSQCTPTSYHACIAYGTATSPLGPWTYRGVILPIVTSTTSHTGTVLYKGEWYIVYHNANAKNGGNFRRSVAMDKLEFDDTTTPPIIKPVKQTYRPTGPAIPTYDRGQIATVHTSPTCGVQYWIHALHDLQIPIAPLPPQYWSSWNAADSAKEVVLTYKWTSPVTLNATSMAFFADHPAGSIYGVAPPTSWSVQYLQNGKWTGVKNSTAYPLNVTNTPQPVEFDQISTTGLRATLYAPTNGTVTAGLGVLEWRALSPDAEVVKPRRSTFADPYWIGL